MVEIGIAILIVFILILVTLGLAGCPYIPHNCVGIIEKLAVEKTAKGAVKAEGDEKST
jgi:hypothetical protein